MKLLESKRLTLPKVYFITSRKELPDIPIGVPFIYGDADDEDYLVRILEYEVLYQEAIKLGYPFNFKKILTKAGFTDIMDFGAKKNTSTYMEFNIEGIISEEFDVESFDINNLSAINTKVGEFKQYIKDASVYVNLEVLKDLKVFPIWLSKIEDAVFTNVHNFAAFNPNMYNKKLDGMYGALELLPPNRNVIIIDISSSIPRGVSATCLTLAKNLAENFYADIVITGSISTLYLYEDLHKLNIKTIYEQNGSSNDQAYFKALLEVKRIYNTAIVFGDNDSPCYGWEGQPTISREQGQAINQWEINKLISFHTGGSTYTAAYADWFLPKEVEKMPEWVTYLN